MEHKLYYGKGKVEQQNARELWYGKVSAEETVRAVHDMLLTAGISMDSVQQTLLRTTVTLQEQVKEFQMALLAEQVSLSTWEEGNLHPSVDHSVSIDPSVSIMRNPFSEKRWKKFQLSRIFSTSPDAFKMHVLDVHITQGDRSFVDKWLVVACLGSGKTRNMALDRRYLPHNLTLFAGVAAHISQNGQPGSPPASSCILSPLPLSGVISMPVTILGCFLTCHIGGRYLFSHSHEHVLMEQANAKDLLAEAWNKELLLCIRDSYVQLVLEFQKIRKDFCTSSIDSYSAHALSYILQAYGDRIYSFWPKSERNSKFYDDVDSATEETITSKASEADWASLVEQVIRPFYDLLIDMPVWQLYCGNVVKADEGMFLSQFGGENVDNLPSARVCSFLKERYPIFSMPSELVKEIQALGIKVREITPKMIRGLLKSSVAVLPESVEMYIDVLDYCLSDIQIPDLSASELSGFNNILDSVDPLQLVSDALSVSAAPFLSSMNVQGIHRDAFQSSSSSGGDALEVVTHFGKAWIICFYSCRAKRIAVSNFNKVSIETGHGRVIDWEQGAAVTYASTSR